MIRRDREAKWPHLKQSCRSSCMLFHSFFTRGRRSEATTSCERSSDRGFSLVLRAHTNIPVRLHSSHESGHDIVGRDVRLLKLDQWHQVTRNTTLPGIPPALRLLLSLRYKVLEYVLQRCRPGGRFCSFSPVAFLYF